MNKPKEIDPKKIRMSARSIFPIYSWSKRINVSFENLSFRKKIKDFSYRDKDNTIPIYLSAWEMGICIQQEKLEKQEIFNRR